MHFWGDENVLYIVVVVMVAVCIFVKTHSIHAFYYMYIVSQPNFLKREAGVA